jgi:hypothetical protein
MRGIIRRISTVHNKQFHSRTLSGNFQRLGTFTFFVPYTRLLSVYENDFYGIIIAFTRSARHNVLQSSDMTFSLSTPDYILQQFSHIDICKSTSPFLFHLECQHCREHIFLLIPSIFDVNTIYMTDYPANKRPLFSSSQHNMFSNTEPESSPHFE